jgi:hypothetical protein
MEYHSSLKKNGNSAICYKMDDSGGYPTKWNNSGPEKQILHDLTYM